MQTTILTVLVALGICQFIYLVWDNPIGFLIWLVLWLVWFVVRFLWFYFFDGEEE